MSRRATACVAAVLASALGGCGTSANLNGDYRMYGGVQEDVRKCQDSLAATSGGPEGEDKPSAGTGFAAGACALADLPLSLMADTVTLPLTIQATLEKEVEKRWPSTAADARQREARLRELDKQQQLLLAERKALEAEAEKDKTGGKAPE